MLTLWKPSSLEKEVYDFFNVGSYGWRPLSDIKETEKEFLIEVDLPGVYQNDIKISVENSVLRLEGERKSNRKDYYKTERIYGNFVRTYTLPSSADQEKIDAIFDLGVLKITIPKKEEKIPKRIEIKTKSPPK